MSSTLAQSGTGALPPTTVRVNATVPIAVHNRIDEEASRENRSRSSMVKILLEEALSHRAAQMAASKESDE
jgi:hypothetical protein